MVTQFRVGDFLHEVARWQPAETGTGPPSTRGGHQYATLQVWVKTRHPRKSLHADIRESRRQVTQVGGLLEVVGGPGRRLLEDQQLGPPAAEQDRQPLLRTDVGDVPQNALSELHRRSLIALPLIAQGRLLGLLYGDMRQVFGRFDENDLNLLGMLANQAAAALENAELVSNLEDKVAERTADLEQRNNELAIISSVQQALAAELDLVRRDLTLELTARVLLRACNDARLWRTAANPYAKQRQVVVAENGPQAQATGGQDAQDVNVVLDRSKAETFGVPVNDAFSALQSYLGSSFVNLARPIRFSSKSSRPIRCTPPAVPRKKTYLPL